MAQPHPKPLLDAARLLTGFPIDSDDGGLTDGTLTVPFTVTRELRSDGSLVFTREVHAQHLLATLMGVLFLGLALGIVLLSLPGSITPLPVSALVLTSLLGLVFAAWAFFIPSLRRAKTRQLVIRGDELAIWLPDLPSAIRRMVWHELRESIVRIHPLSLPDALWKGHAVALEVGGYRMLLGASKDRSELESIVQALPDVVRSRWSPEPGILLVAPKSDRWLIRRGSNRTP